jgi:undecaprenyl-diphosphatase
MDLQTVTEIDRQILSVFNDHHNLFFDTLMLTLTSGVMWIPLYIALLYLVVKNNETMAQIGLIVACSALCLFLTEFVTEGLVKPAVARPRPCNDPEWMYVVHVVNGHRSLDYSFFSAHASNTFGITMFFCLLVRNKVFSWLMVTWSLLNCYTRLYLAMHYPSDILVGLAYGALVGTLVYMLFRLVSKRLSLHQRFISSQYTASGYSLSDIDVVACVLVATYILAIIISLTMH